MSQPKQDKNQKLNYITQVKCILNSGGWCRGDAEVTGETSRYHQTCTCPRSVGIIILKLHKSNWQSCIPIMSSSLSGGCSKTPRSCAISCILQLASSVSTELTLCKHGIEKAWIKSMIGFNLAIMR